ncbi:phage baseplate upper protein [Bacillus haynesii]|uniref:BppU family phage baseplate upper protein n=1 Tax=Bacillus haynesii TaxID=1925021 RepID=UPI0022815D55|nr:BppU family phage baseplate upper protein [Bacillus haynesii]MCY8347586.1 phage baseplate upper protein [Bacillus haynesii]
MSIYKLGSYDFDINANTEGKYNSAFIFSTQDINTAKLVFYLRKDGIPLPLSAVTGKVILVPSSGKQRIRDVTIVDPLNGVAEYVLDEDEIKMYGKFNCQLILKYTNGQSLSAHKFGFEVSQSLADQNIAPLAEYYVDDFESLKALIIAMYDEETAMLDELKAKFSDLDRIETKEGAQEKADTAEADAKAYTDEHVAKTDNPHKVTKAQVGLSNVDNVKQATKTEFDSHANNKSNPHAVTKAQVGLANVDNVKQASKTDFDAHTADNVRHITADERTKWSAGQLFKITLDDGQPLVYVNATDDFHELLPRYRGFVHFSSHPNAINGPGGALRGFWNCNSTGTYGQIIAFDNSNRTFRKSIANGNWSGWEILDTATGSQAKADKALADAKTYVANFSWVVATLQNGWTHNNGGEDVAFGIDATKTVYVRGAAKDGATGTTVFTLPTNMRPVRDMSCIQIASGTAQVARLLFKATGEVVVESVSSNTNYVRFDFAFKAL